MGVRKQRLERERLTRNASLKSEAFTRQFYRVMGKTVIAVVDDLFFASKIRGAGEQVGARVLFTKSIPEAIERARAEGPASIIADLNTRSCDAIELACALKSDDTLNGIPLLGFFSHVQTELQQAAITAGFDRVMPRSAFSKNLPEILSGKTPD